jgi:hypothetical protein
MSSSPLDVERFGAIDVGHWYCHEFDFPVHADKLDPATDMLNGSKEMLNG